MSCANRVIVVGCGRTRVISSVRQIPAVVNPPPREVYSETPDPVVTLPSINFVPGEWADPDIFEMKVFVP